MPDILLRHVEESLFKRIKLLARERGCSINDTVVHVLQTALGPQQVHFLTDIEDLDNLPDTWDVDETAVFREAVDAMEHVPDGALGEEPDELPSGSTDSDAGAAEATPDKPRRRNKASDNHEGGE